MNENHHPFIAYLSAKKAVDDRSLNPRVWSAFLDSLAGLRGDGALRIAELGAGIGTMCERVLGALGADGIRYHLVDEKPDLLETAARRIGAGFFPGQAGLPAGIVLHASEAGDWLSDRTRNGTFHAILAHAFMDLVDIPRILDLAFARLDPGGLAYLTVNYDGRTDFIPALEQDAEILGRYNESMRSRKGGYFGTDKSGGRILEFLLERGYPVLEAGSSDWVIVPRGGRGSGPGYTEDEILFLRSILSMLEGSVAQSGFDRRTLGAWMSERTRQLAAGSLSFVAHQLDILAAKPV